MKCTPARLKLACHLSIKVLGSHPRSMVLFSFKILYERARTVISIPELWRGVESDRTVCLFWALAHICKLSFRTQPDLLCLNVSQKKFSAVTMSVSETFSKVAQGTRILQVLFENDFREHLYLWGSELDLPLRPKLCGPLHMLDYMSHSTARKWIEHATWVAHNRCAQRWLWQMSLSMP